MAALPTLPTEYSWPAMPTDFTGWNTYHPTSAADLKSLLNGDVSGVGQIDRSSKNCVIYLDPEVTREYVTGGYNQPFHINNVSAITTGQDTYWIVIMPIQAAYANFNSLFPEGIRIDPDRPTPGDHSHPCSYTYMPKISHDSTNTPTLRIDFTAKKIRFVGLHFTHDSSTVVANACVHLSRDSSPAYAAQVSDLNEEIIFDRCLVRAPEDNWTGYYTYGIAANANKCAIVDSVIDGWRGTADAQAVWIFNGVSQVHVENCYLCGSGESWFTGALRPPTGQDTQPHNLVVRGNHFKKDPRWDKWSDNAAYLGTSWTIKNHLETKEGNLILIENNCFDYFWSGTGGAQYNAMVIKAANQPHGSYGNGYYTHPSDNTRVAHDTYPFTSEDVNNNLRVVTAANPGWYNITSVADDGGTSYAQLDGSPDAVDTYLGAAYRGFSPWIYIADITVRYNTFSRCVSGIYGIWCQDGGYTTAGAHRIHIHDNHVVFNQHAIDRYQEIFYRREGIDQGGGLSAAYNDPDEDGVKDLTIEHNTFVTQPIARFSAGRTDLSNEAEGLQQAWSGSGQEFGDEYVNRYNVQDTGEYGAVVRQSSTYGDTSLSRSFLNYTWGPNIQIGNVRNSSANYSSPQTAAYFADAYSDVGFEDYANGNFRITSAGTNGDYRVGQAQGAADGKAFGPDFDTLEPVVRAAQDGRRSVKRRLLVRA